MPTIQAQPIDVQWIVALASGTTYGDYNSALSAAVTLSSGNSNAAVQIGKVLETHIFGTNPVVQLPGNGTPLFVIQLASGTTYYPLSTARVQADTTSSSNSNAAVYVARVIEQVTAP